MRIDSSTNSDLNKICQSLHTVLLIAAHNLKGEFCLWSLLEHKGFRYQLPSSPYRTNVLNEHMIINLEKSRFQSGGVGWGVKYYENWLYYSNPHPLPLSWHQRWRHVVSTGDACAVESGIVTPSLMTTMTTKLRVWRCYPKVLCTNHMLPRDERNIKSLTV